MTRRSFQRRCLILCSFFMIGLSLLSARLIQIQVLDRQKYRERARAAYDRSEILPGIRGNIVDRNDEVLAKSIGLSTLMVDANLFRDPVVVVRALAYERASHEADWEMLSGEEKSRKLKVLRGLILEEDEPSIIVERYLARAVGMLARPMGLRREELRERIEGPIKKGRAYFAIAKDLPEDAADALRDLIEKNDLKGFRWENSIKRWYSSPELAAHVVGYTGEEESVDDRGRKSFVQVGKFGVEAAMEDYLRGRDGRWDHLNIPMPGEKGDMIPPVHGLNVQLTLDMGLQAIVEEEFDAGLEKYVAHRGCVVVLDPNSGELLAMVSRPSFNLNLKEGLAEGAMNFALQGIYEPGSTFKLVATSGVLNEGLATPGTMTFCHNGLFVEGKLRIPDHAPYGMLSVAGVLKKSSNIGAFKLARQLGPERFFEYAHRYGFGQETGILLSGESAGVVRNTGNLIDFSRAAYGYALNVTPLQVATAYSVVANGGELIRPRVVRSIIGSDGTVLERFEPEIERRVITERTARQMREALITVVEKGGTATAAAVPGFKVAGKTGTARRVKNGGYQVGHYTVSFVGMMPAENPEFVCLVVVDDPRPGDGMAIGGGSVAAPIFSKIAARVATHLHLTPTEPVPDEGLAASER
ncbi:cell division protein FtsI/penicillin-binding protein 2 [Haloferula luteola]|uniref:Cell division protein FtsI/penicillin-binding protein 2 n=1 Tax=Haloferula luteola TaxID=595692 RepID=A0A840V4H1_9BACT|nr:penicillin-binding protein 2 [Haloferula luteola]MBB5351946.1 cell division protein FtsI/penicillin-binding protein 2 [Haloferula luteola]